MASNRPALLFQEIEPPHELLPAILVHIARERRRAARLQLGVFGTLSFVSALMLIPAVQYAIAEFSSSGFYEYASLLFDGFARGYWQEILYSLNNSLPSLALLILASVIAAGTWSLLQASRNARSAFARIALS
jgi:hypothetical protein